MDEELKEKLEKNLEIMEENIAMHGTTDMSSEGIVIEEIDDKPVKKSFTEEIHGLLKDFSK